MNNFEDIELKGENLNKENPGKDIFYLSIS